MQPNPYASPQTVSKPLANIVDRHERTELAAIIRRFLADEVSAFGFDDQLDAYRQSPDNAVQYVALAVWYHYDDCDDHHVVLAKPEWDYFQRLLLLLESDCRIEVVKRRRWHWSQIVAIACLVAFLAIAWKAGVGPHLFLLNIPILFISLGLGWVRNRSIIVGPYDQLIAPFGNFASLKEAYESAHFKKQRYPQWLQKRKVRSVWSQRLLQFQVYAVLLLVSPIFLVMLSLPHDNSEVHTMNDS